MGEENKPSLRGAHILVVEDEPALLRGICRMLRSVDAECDAAESVDDAFVRLGSSIYDVVLTDVSLGKRSGEEVLARALALPTPPKVLVMSGMATIDLAVRAMRLGASDFFEKPIHEALLFARIGNIIESARMRLQLEALTSRGATGVVGMAPQSTAMAQALALAEKIASTPHSSALLIGESGVGKEVLASHIHRKSERHAEPFVRVNVAAIPETMIESELFGSVKGAFTDSKQNRVGHIASADRGTILLDEIGELRVDYQPKLLRVLEERRFFPMGSDRERPVDVRFLAATNREPEEMIARGMLRRDLFYRLGVVVRIPPLRSRRDEILPLARHFLEHFCAEFARPPVHLTPSAERVLVQHRWPGNIRELRNVIERAVMVTPGDEMSAEALDLFTPVLTPWAGMPAPSSPSSGGRKSIPPPASIPPAAPGASVPAASSAALPVAARAAAEQVERERIVDVLKLVGGSRSRAATTLGVSRSTLYEKLKRYGLE
jgi:DNA-binding NtrC family response regulator